MNISTGHNSLPYSKQTELDSILCLAGGGCSIVAGGVLFIYYFSCSYSIILQSAFNDVFVAVVVIQVLQALQLSIFALITVIRGHGNVPIGVLETSDGTPTAYGMTYEMCNVNASLHQFLDTVAQVLQMAFFVVLANTRRLTSLEELEISDGEGVVRTCGEGSRGGFIREEDHGYSSSGRSSISVGSRTYGIVHATERKYYREDYGQGDESFCFRIFIKPLRQRCPCFLSCSRKRDNHVEASTPPHGTLGLRRGDPGVRTISESAGGGVYGRHALLRITWKIYLAAILYASAVLMACWVVLIFVSDFRVILYGDETQNETPRTVSNSLFFSQHLAWCWIPGSDDLDPHVSFISKVGLILLQVAAAYAFLVLFCCSAIYAYIALRRCSPSLVRDHPVILWRISVFCAYPTLVYILGAVDRFVCNPNQSSSQSWSSGSKVHLVLSALISFMYPFTAVVNVLIFLCTEKLLHGICTTTSSTRREERCGNCFCLRFWCCCNTESDGNEGGDHLDCYSDILQDRLTSEGGDDNNVMATTGFCGMVKVIACSTVTGLPPGAPTTTRVGLADNESNNNNNTNSS